MSGERWLALARAWFVEEIVDRVFEPHRRLAARTRPAARRRSGAIGAAACTVLRDQRRADGAVAIEPGLPERVTLSAWIATEAFVVAGTAAEWFFFFGANHHGARHLLPALVSVALPLALVPAAIVMSRFATAVELRTMMVRLTLLSVLLLIPTLAWWLPASNQSWRVVQAGEAVHRGYRELSVNDLLRSQAPADVGLGKARDWETLRRDAALERASILVMPFTMMAFGLSMARRAGRGWAVRAMAAWMTAGLIWLTLLDISPWLAHVAISAASMAGPKPRHYRVESA
jgi:hypothetical protein